MNSIIISFKILFLLLILISLHKNVKTQFIINNNNNNNKNNISENESISTKTTTIKTTTFDENFNVGDKVFINLEAVNLNSINSYNLNNNNNNNDNNNINNNNNTNKNIQNIKKTEKNYFNLENNFNELKSSSLNNFSNLLNETKNATTNNRENWKFINYRKIYSKKLTILDVALQSAARQGLEAMNELYNNLEPAILEKKQYLQPNHPAALLSKFSAQSEQSTQYDEKAAFATIEATKSFQKSYSRQTEELGRQATRTKISFRRTALEGLCPPRELPICLPAAMRYRTHDGTCNNIRRPRWGSAQMPFNRFLPPEYGDGVDSIRSSADGGALSSARFVSLLVHGSREGEAPVTLLLAQWGQLIDHDMTSTAQPRSINGSVPRCCGPNDFHPSCFPIKVPVDDPWLAPLKVRCLEFLRSAPAQRRDCMLSWREQTNQATSFIDASPIYSSNARTSDNARVFRNGLLFFGRGNPLEDVCHRGAVSNQCIRPGDARSGEQPGLLALHHVWVTEHNRITSELSDLNPHWSDEKFYQETRRIIGALFQHITYREFLPLVLGKEVCRLFDLELLNSGYYNGYDPRTNPSISNSFAAAAFRFGHSLVQGSYMRCDFNHNFIDNNVTLHEEFARGDIGSSGSLHRLLRGLAAQRSLKRDEFITPELTNHLFQSGNFPFGLDLAAINIQRGRDHGIPPYTKWRQPCGLSVVSDWDDMIQIVGPESVKRIRHAYSSVHDIDLFVGGIAERPVVGGLVGPTFACIIAQQFSNLRKGDRFWYENNGFENSFTPAQLHSIRRVSLAQILCRVTASGTFQPHIFVPHEVIGNHRIICGEDSLARMDLLPWKEQDPFELPERKQVSEKENSEKENSFSIITDTNPTDRIVNNDKAESLITVNNVDFIPNGSTGFHKRPDSKVHDKIDFVSKFSKPVNIRPHLENILENRTKKPNTSPIKLTTTKRTVVINNIPIELGRTANPPLTSKSANKTTERSTKRDFTLKEQITKQSTSCNILLNKCNENNDKTLNNNSSNNINFENVEAYIKLNVTFSTFEKKTSLKSDESRKKRKLILIQSANNTIATKTKLQDTIKTTTYRSTKLKPTPVELRNYYEEPNHRPQKIINRFHSNAIRRPTETITEETIGTPHYEIEINIRQTSKVSKPKYQPQVDIKNSQISPPRRNDPNFYTQSSSPFSHNRPVVEAVSNYEIPNSVNSGTFTKPPKIIYINEPDEYYSKPETTTNRPNLFQTIFGLNNNPVDRTSYYGQANSVLLNSDKPNTYEVDTQNSPNKHFGATVTLNIRPLSGTFQTKPVGLDDSYLNNGFNRKPEYDFNKHYVSISPPVPTYSASGFINTRYNENQEPFRQTTTLRPSYSTQNDYINIYGSDNFRNNYEPETKFVELNIAKTHLPLKMEPDFNITNSDKENISRNFDVKDENSKENTEYDYYDDEEQNEETPDKKFDKDGYLRPEHMHFYLSIINKTEDNATLHTTIKSTIMNDNFVMPLLEEQHLIIEKKSNFVLPILTPRKPLRDDVEAEDEYDDSTIKPVVLLNMSEPKRPEQRNGIDKISLPERRVDILTKPERPDNWIIFDPQFPEKPPLPEIPELKTDNSFTTKEFPKPMQGKKNWKSYF